MKKTFRRYCPLIALLATVGAAQAADDGPHSIKLVRPHKVGDTYVMHVTGEQSGPVITTMAGQAPDISQQYLKFELIGRVTVNEVDPQGNDTSLTITVSQFSVNCEEHFPAATEKIALAPASVIDLKITTDEVTPTVRRGGALGEAGFDALMSIFTTINPSTVTEDDISGSKEPRKVGDTWPINAEAAAKQLLGYHMKIDPKNIKGSTSIKSADTVDGVPVLRIMETMDFTAAVPTDDSETKVDSAHWQSTVLMPIDPGLPIVRTEDVTDQQLAPTKPLPGGKPMEKSHSAQITVNSPVK